MRYRRLQPGHPQRWVGRARVDLMNAAREMSLPRCAYEALIADVEDRPGTAVVTFFGEEARLRAVLPALEDHARHGRLVPMSIASDALVGASLVVSLPDELERPGEDGRGIRVH